MTRARLPMYIRPRVERMLLCELFDRRAVVAEIFRDDDLRDDELIAFFTAALDPAAFDAQLCVAAGACGDRQRHRAIERRHFDLRSKQRFPKADRQIEHDVESFAAEVDRKSVV